VSDRPSYSLAPRRATRLPLVAVMVVSVLAAGVLRATATDFQARQRPGGTGNRSASALGSMNSFALALLLGGLRGPLAMVLWATSESQKADRNLEDFDTKVEWIRLLQPEFDTVHLFQIWNKAYNISVQYASLPNRYSAILDALDYAREVDKSRPDNVNIMNAIAQVYSNKLGTPHSEKNFYRRWVREQSFVPKDWQQGERRDQPAWQRRRMEPKIDANGMILPHLLAPKPGRVRPKDLPPDSDWNNGAELQYLEKYQPFPYGVSTFALAYNYSKRAQVIMRVDKQSPLQVSDGVIDSRPALELKSWSEDEWERGRVAEIEAFGLQVPAERLDMEFPTATLPPDLKNLKDVTEKGTDKRRDAADEAVFSYDRAVRLAADANAEYARHMADPKYFDRAATYRSHVASLEAMAHLAAADRDYLKAALLPAGAAQREKLLADAFREYQESIGAYQLVILRFFVTDEFAKQHFGDDLTRASVVDQPRAVQDRVMQRVREALVKSPPIGSEDDIAEYERYIARAEARLGQAMKK
jgi:hypothetical protein